MEKKSIGAVPAVLPMPVLMVAAYDENGVVNVMNAAWGMISAPDRISLFIDSEHKTTKNIRETGAFTVALADVEHIEAADFFGIATGNKMPDKFERSGLTATKSEKVNAPVIDQFPVTMECELLGVIDNDLAYQVVGKIVDVVADWKVLGEDGKVDPEKTNVLIFDQFRSDYYSLGDKVGRAWNAGKPLMKKE